MGTRFGRLNGAVLGAATAAALWSQPAEAWDAVAEAAQSQGASVAKAASAPATASTPAASGCEGILAGAPSVGPYKADALCPAINSLRSLFAAPEDGNYAPTVAYTQPSDAFFAGLAASMKHYKGKPIAVPVGGTQSITLAGLDTLEEANGYKRSKLGLILERIRVGDDRGRHVGKVCMSYAESAADENPVIWIGSAFLKYGLPALVKLLKGNPSRIIDRYDAMVLTERGSADQRTAPIRAINFVARGSLPAGCKAA